ARSPGHDDSAQRPIDGPRGSHGHPAGQALRCAPCGRRLRRSRRGNRSETGERSPYQSGHRRIPNRLGAKMKFGVIIFPGSNCDYDCYYAVQSVIGKPVEFIWHQDTSVKGFDAIILPGGFAYGDYLRTGALAKFSPVMQAVKDFAAKGGLVIGICNGFQILTESGILPGALLTNVGRKYICRFLHLRTETANSPFTNALRQEQWVNLPIG